MNRVALIVGVGVALGAANGPGTDPLPSWNDGRVKRAILGFVARVTAPGPDHVPPAERIAVFDNDGTLWAEQPVYFQVAFILDRVKSLLARVKSAIDRLEPRLPLDKIPLKIPPRQKLYALIGAALFVLLLLIGAFVLVLGFAFRSTDDKKDGGAAAAVDHRAKIHAAAQAGDHASVVREAAVWAAGPHSDKDADEIARAVEAASAAQEDAAFELMEHKLGAAGVDALYDLAYGAPSQSTANAALTTRAKKSLQDDALKSKMSPALTVTLAIKTTQDVCAAKTKYFAQAASVGDARTEAVLAPLLKKTGCGRRGRVDCHPCLRTGDDSVEKTVAAIRARVDAGAP